MNKKSILNLDTKFIVKSESMPKFVNMFQSPKAIIDDSLYTHSIISLSKPLKEKETIFFTRVSEMEKEEDVVKRTLKAIETYKR